MKHLIKTNSQQQFNDNLTNNSTLPLNVISNNSQIWQMSPLRIIRMLELENVQGQETEKTNYIEQLNDILSVYNNA